MKKWFKTNRVVACVAMVVMALSMVSCYDEEEKALVGTWEMTTSNDGLMFVTQMKFSKGEETNKFVEKIIPQSIRGIGYSVEGTWELDIAGDLEVHYNVNSLKPLSSGLIDEFDVKTYMMTVKLNIISLNAQTESGAAIPFEVKGKKLKLTTADGVMKLTRVGAGNSKSMESGYNSESEPHPSRVYEGEEIDYSDVEGDPPIEEY